MEVIEGVGQMQMRAERLRQAGHTICLVPTMGFLHEGHLTLMRIGKAHADILILSIFVNPTQFGPSEDYEAYPRDTEGDLLKAERMGADIVFMPRADEMYGKGFQTKVSLGDLTRHLCGRSRPDHFDGVATVVAKLFNITKPHLAVFGQKDYQQLAVITRMVRDLNMDIEIIGAPTVRETDGLAMSSRNSYLDPEARRSALCLKEAMDLADGMVKQGERDARVIKRAIEALIEGVPLARIDYVSMCDPVTLDPVETMERETLLALAVRVGKTRLIDNRMLSGDA